MKRGILAALAVLATLGPLGAFAASGPSMGPQSGWTDMQKYEYYIGQIGSALNICGHFSLSSDLKRLADLSPYGRKGWQSMMSFDGIRGGHCGLIAADARKILADGSKLSAYLTDKYDCPGGQCAPEGGDKSVLATCRAEADEHLASLPVPRDDVKGVTMVSRNVGQVSLSNGKPGYEAWVRLDSCSGWLVIVLSKACYPQQAFTRGACKVDGIKSF